MKLFANSSINHRLLCLIFPWWYIVQILRQNVLGLQDVKNLGGVNLSAKMVGTSSGSP